MSSLVEDVLKDVREPVLFVPNGGNAGDSLINVGFYQIAERVGLRFRTIRRADHQLVTRDATVVVAGGGALVPEWSATPQFVRKALPRSRRMIVLPQSIRGVEDVVASFRSQDVVMCRELYSLRHCREHNTRAALLVDHDLALSADPERVLRHRSSWRPPRSAHTVVRDATIVYHQARARRRASVNAYRCDREAAEGSGVARRWTSDFSSIARFATGGVEESWYSARRLLELIGLYSEIRTDRLHVAIGSVLLGKRVVAMPNSYYKLRGVVEFSLSEYPHLQFAA